jgi:hypothetical protein
MKVALIGPELAKMEDCLAMARIHHEAFMKGNQRVYVRIWGAVVRGRK